MIGPLALACCALLALYLGWGLEIWSLGTPGSGLLPSIAALILLVASLGSFSREKGSDEAPGNLPRAACYAGGLVAIPPAVMLPRHAAYPCALHRRHSPAGGRVSHVHCHLDYGASISGNWLLFGKLLLVRLPEPIFW